MSIDSLITNVSNFVLKSTSGRSYILYKTIFINNQRYSADPINIHRPIHDGCVLYDNHGTAAVGFLETVINFLEDKGIFLVIRPVILNSTADILTINNRIYRCTNVLYGSSHGSSLELIHHKSLIQKLAFRYGINSEFPSLVKSMFFFQFPNLRSSDLLPLPKCYEFMAVIQQKLTDDCGVIKPTVRYSVSANQYLIQHHTAYMNEQLLPLEKIEEMFQCRKVNVVPIRIIDSHAYNNCKTSAPIILDSNEDFFGPNRTHKPGDDSIWKIESVMEKSTFPWIYPTGEGGELDMKRPISLKLRLMSANKTWQGYSILTFRAMNLIQKDDFCTAVNYHTIKKFN
ncbi:unnamed protein product [Rotaria magnacalcarata]|uniref:Uncharacterized protein n=1 Tax=Rotaria magnacalcarata TaxID=392030 RepID=A0A816ZJG6_9BILA|nr:unnamed protein product [Rotaria magnacalcarata]CAF1666563.1 unnamed protein product [Rotaria magnacalcarata]CAF2080667.1 unnamed protein product [Rotaria magnacalcarata]CAF2135493.1 unnamed protein product [Rotaria magnacalcarata]CAF2210117.1 unnamed protein product [Rotaria magnacalcarata]